MGFACRPFSFGGRMILLYIALGGAAGAVARYGLGGWVQGRLGHDFPVGHLWWSTYWDRS